MAKKAVATNKRKPYHHHDAQTKCEAVLAVWTERRKPSQICKELGITWSQLSMWQDKALAAMLEALEPRRSGEEATPNLTKSLQKLFEKKGLRQEQGLVDSRLEKRLNSIQADKPKQTTKG